MDIEYLLFLQTLREGAPAWLNSLLEAVSEFAISPFALIIPCVLFWCIAKEDGLTVLLTNGLGRGVNGLVKNTACVYRPWIRDERVQTSLMSSASGYSFPSGHTTWATALYGGIGVNRTKHTGKKWKFFVWCIPALLTGFARNWVGAHTPQDVVVGFLLTLGTLYISVKILAYVQEHPEKDGKIALIVILAGLATLIYIVFKPYPLDYNADGSLLVDPVKMMKDAFADIGAMIGVFTGWYLERHFVKFEIEGVSTKTKVIRGVIGAVLGYVLYTYVLSNLGVLIPQDHAVYFIKNFVLLLYLVFIYPAIFKAVETKLIQK